MTNYLNISVQKTNAGPMRPAVRVVEALVYIKPG